MRPTLALLLAVLLGAAVAPYPQSPASASCVGPSLVGDDIVLHRGVAETVEGQWFVDGCEDTMSCPALGCGHCEYDDPETPSQDVHLSIRQHGRTWPLGMEDAGDRGAITWTFTLPSETRAGRARLVADGDRPVVVRIR